MVEYMKRFGFYSDPELDLADAEMTASGPLNSNGNLVTSGFDVGRVAIGQGGAEGQMLGTPFQMAEVAATVANGGSADEADARPEGRPTPTADGHRELKPQAQATVISPRRRAS